MTEIDEETHDERSKRTLDEKVVSTWNKILEHGKSLGIVALGILCAVLLLMKQCNEGGLKRELTELQNFNSALIDTIKVVKNKDGTKTTSITTIQTQDIDDFLAITKGIVDKKDEEIQRLRTEVLKYKGKLEAGSSVTTVTATTNFQSSSHTLLSPNSDTIYLDNTAYIYPEYIVSDTGRSISPSLNKEIDWVILNGTINKDNSNIGLSITNMYSVVIGYEGKFKKRKPVAYVTNENPYTDVSSMRTYQVKVPAERRLGIGIAVGYGGYFDPVKLRVGSGVIAGITLNYNIFKLK